MKTSLAPPGDELILEGLGVSPGIAVGPAHVIEAGVVLLTDMFGGTPSNLAISVLDKANVEVIAGVNLPLLIKLASVRKTEPLAPAVASAQAAGRKYINVASGLLAGEGE